MVEHATENRGVASSILALGTSRPVRQANYAGVVQLVERLLAKEKVVGSSPIARSGIETDEWRLLIGMLQSAILILAPGSFGDVAKWKGKGLQNPDHGFKSRRRL